MSTMIHPEAIVDVMDLQFGQDCTIEKGCVLKAHYLRLGDHVYIGEGTKIIAPAAAIGDYSTIYERTLVYGRKPVVIGHNFWAGRDCVLNCEDRLIIGNGVGMGIQNAIYTHGYWGDLLAGCQVFTVKPTTLEDDVWIMGSYSSVYPGLVLGQKSMVLPGSVVTRNVRPNTVVGGAPAKEVKLIPYGETSLEARRELFDRFVEEYRAKGGEVPDLSMFDLMTHTYHKTRDPREVAFLKFLLSHRGRFVPFDQPRVTLPDEFN